MTMRRNRETDATASDRAGRRLEAFRTNQAVDSSIRFRVVTWNLNHAFRGSDDPAQWSFLESLNPHVALLQEARWPPIPDSVGSLIGGTRGWGTWVVPYRGTVLHEVPWVPLGTTPLPKGHLEASHPGCFSVAETVLPQGNVVTLASVYGMLAFKVRNGMRYAVTTLKRTLSDLTPVLDVNRSGAAVVMSGDLNVSPQIRWPDTAAHQAVIQRIEAFGLRNCLGDTHDGFVRTYQSRTARSRSSWQGDWVFASNRLKLITCEPVDSEDAWALSDHCPVVAEFEIVDSADDSGRATNLKRARHDRT